MRTPVNIGYRILFHHYAFARQIIHDFMEDNVESDAVNLCTINK